MKTSGFWRLLGAYSMDVMVLLCFNYVWICAFGIILSVNRGLPVGLLWFGLGGWILCNVAYFAGLEQGGKGTFGKRIFGLQLQPAASFWKVFAAYAIDAALFILIGSCMYFCMKYQLISHLTAAELEYQKIGILISIKLLGLLFLISTGILISSPFYFSVLESTSGQTLGKKLMGLTVVQAASKAAPVKQKEETK